MDDARSPQPGVPRGPLTGVRVLDLTGLGPGPYCAMLLGDLGADVVRVERPGSGRFAEPEKYIPHRSRRSAVINLASPTGVDLVLRMVEGADVLIDHDVNYLSITGALGRFKRDGERPVFPLNLVADGGGGAILAFGIAAALFERSVSGRGQVIDAAMADSVAGQLALPLAHLAMDRLNPPGQNFYDSGAHFYEVYETADGRYLSG